jgi:hypothetical protein
MDTINFMDNISNITNSLNSSKYFFALVMLTMNIAGRYIELDIAKHHKQFLSSSKIFKRLLIFTIAFIATRDVVASLIITASFIIIVMHLFNNESDYCILPKSFVELDTDKDGDISPEEIKQAYEKLKKAGKIK